MDRPQYYRSGAGAKPTDGAQSCAVRSAIRSAPKGLSDCGAPATRKADGVPRIGICHAFVQKPLHRWGPFLNILCFAYYFLRPFSRAMPSSSSFLSFPFGDPVFGRLFYSFLPETRHPAFLKPLVTHILHICFNICEVQKNGHVY